MTRSHQAADDPYAALRCRCDHLVTAHDGDRCLAGEHTVPCRCEGYFPIEFVS